MKKLNIKIKPETAVSVALGVLGIAQMVLTNKKDANDKAQLKDEILKEAMKDKGVIISRTHPFESKKQKCLKCNSLGYEYLITNKKEG